MNDSIAPVPSHPSLNQASVQDQAGRASLEHAFPYCHILGVRVDSISLDDLITYILDAATNHRQTIVQNINVHAVNLADDIPWFRAYLNSCPLVFCDGFGIKWAAAFLYKLILYRHTPPDWFPMLARVCAERRISIYFLGAEPGVAERAASVLSSGAPGLQVVGCQHGYFDKSPGSPENQAVIARINAISPDILVIGFGMPAQERWLMDNLRSLKVSVAIPIGAAFDYISGGTPRAPGWMTSHGLEWLGRLLIEPRRLWRRYLLGNPRFLWRICKARWTGPRVS